MGCSEENNMKALFIIVNAGFSDNAIEITRECGATGATIINARGTAGSSFSLFGINYEPEKEIILSIVEETVSKKIMDAIAKNNNTNPTSSGICFSLPVDRVTLLNKK